MRDERMISMPVGIVVQRRPGVTRWAKHAWKAVALLPGADPVSWREIRREGDVVEYHAATLTMELHRTETEAYVETLNAKEPKAFVVLRAATDPERPFDLFLITASAYEAQDYGDSSEDIVEPVPMSAGLIAWVRDFVAAHHEETPFVKRRRDRKDIDLVEDGIGDARIKQTSDVYRAPTKRRRLQ